MPRDAVGAQQVHSMPWGWTHWARHGMHVQPHACPPAWQLLLNEGQQCACVHFVCMLCRMQNGPCNTAAVMGSVKPDPGAQQCSPYTQLRNQPFDEEELDR
jgi:hypothetical protein